MQKVNPTRPIHQTTLHSPALYKTIIDAKTFNIKNLETRIYYNQRKKKTSNDIIYLSKPQKYRNTKSTKDENQRKQRKIHRSRILTEIRATLRHLEN